MIELPTIAGGWATLLIDPPWRLYENTKLYPRDPNFRAKIWQYPTMEDQEVLHLPIGRILAENSQAWLWATNSHLYLAFRCLERWGLEFKTMVTWVKDKPGLGSWLRGQTEHLLLGIRGSPRDKYATNNTFTGELLSTVLFAERREHSRKPDAAYVLIEKVSVEPHLELFARRRRAGWHAWGNQVEEGVQEVFNAGS